MAERRVESASEAEAAALLKVSDISPLHLPCISPISRLYVRCISQVSGAEEAEKALRAQLAAAQEPTPNPNPNPNP